MTYKTLQSCPVCNGLKIKYLLTGKDHLHHITGEWDLWTCESCTTGFLNPMPTHHIIPHFYPNDYYAYQPPRLPTEPTSNVKKLAWHWRHQRFNAYAKSRGYSISLPSNLFAQLSVRLFPPRTKLPTYISKGCFLDIGCGAGHYLLEMKQLGWDTTGVELSKPACKAAQQAGLNVHNKSLEDMHFTDNSFDIVRMADVLEHVSNPHHTLDEIHRILKPNCKLTVILPNINAWTFGLFKEYWFPLEIPRHLFHHTPKSIHVLAKQHGFKVSTLDVWSHKEVDVIPSLPWLLKAKAPSIYRLLNHKPIWKMIRKCFAFPKKIASFYKKGSAMTITLTKLEKKHD